jgi:hypothetical protein
VLELVGTFVFALTLETLIGRRASGLFTKHAKLRLHPGITQEVAPNESQKSAKATYVGKR